MRVATAPAWTKGSAYWKVEVLGPTRNGNVLVRWLEGPLKGKEARLQARTLQKGSNDA
jgi:hypothetical protein